MTVRTVEHEVYFSEKTENLKYLKDEKKYDALLELRNVLLVQPSVLYSGHRVFLEAKTAGACC